MPLIPEAQLEQIRERVDIAEFIGQQVALKKAGQNFKGLCPFHQEKTPSFTVNPDKQIYHCFGCGQGGNIFSFVMEFEGIGFLEAAEQLAVSAGITLNKINGPSAKNFQVKKQLNQVNRLAAEFYFNQLHQQAGGRKALAYLQERGLQQTTMQRYLLGYAPEGGRTLVHYLQKRKIPLELIIKAGLARRGGAGDIFDFFRNRLIFPIRNGAGDFIAFGGRILDKSESQQPKYLNTPETPLYHKGRELYGLYEARTALRESGQALVVEGYMDVIALAQHGFEQAVAPLGTALTVEQIKRIQRQATELYMIFDGDSAGQKAAWRALETVLATQASARMVALPTDQDPDSFVRTQGAEAFRTALLAAPGLMDYFIDRLVAQSPPDNLGKISAVRRLVPQLALVLGEVEKALYIQRLAGSWGFQKGPSSKNLSIGGREHATFKTNLPMIMTLSVMLKKKCR